MERCGVGGGRETASTAGEDGQGAGDLSTDGIDGAEMETVGVIEQRPGELAVARQNCASECAGLAIEGIEGRIVFGRFDLAACSCARTRSRSSAVALLVKVMARTCSGESTDSSARSLR